MQELRISSSKSRLSKVARRLQVHSKELLKMMKILRRLFCNTKNSLLVKYHVLKLWLIKWPASRNVLRHSKISSLKLLWKRRNMIHIFQLVWCCKEQEILSYVNYSAMSIFLLIILKALIAPTKWGGFIKICSIPTMYAGSNYLKNQR